MNAPEIYSLERGDLVRVTVDPGETIEGEVMENSTFEAPSGETQQSIIIKTRTETYAVQKIEKGERTEQTPLKGGDIEGFVSEVEHIEANEVTE